MKGITLKGMAHKRKLIRTIKSQNTLSSVGFNLMIKSLNLIICLKWLSKTNHHMLSAKKKIFRSLRFSKVPVFSIKKIKNLSSHQKHIAFLQACCDNIGTCRYGNAIFLRLSMDGTVHLYKSFFCSETF